MVRLGRPLPVEYLLVDCPVSTPNEPIYTFSHRSNSFPIENRLVKLYILFEFCSEKVVLIFCAINWFVTFLVTIRNKGPGVRNPQSIRLRSINPILYSAFWGQKLPPPKALGPPEPKAKGGEDTKLGIRNKKGRLLQNFVVM